MDAARREDRTGADRATTPGAGATSAVGDRIVGLDLARFVALVGMMAAHVWYFDPAGGSTTLILTVVQGRAAALFAVLAGVGIVLSTSSTLARASGSASDRCRGFAAAARMVFARGAVIAAIGLTLGFLPTQAAIILVSYGVLFWAVIPLLRASAATLATVAAVGAVVAPLASFWVRAGGGLARVSPENPSWARLGDPALVLDIMLTGAFPVSTWFVYIVAGMAVGRLLLAARAVHGDRRGRAIRTLARRLAAVGATVAVAAWALAAREPVGDDATTSGLGVVPIDDPSLLVSAVPHSAAPLDLLHTAGAAICIIGLCVLLGSVVRGRVALAVSPMTAAGAASLTIYSVHLVAESIAVRGVLADGAVASNERWMLSSPQLWALHVAGALVIGLVLALLHRRGPLESVVSITARWAGRCTRAS